MNKQQLSLWGKRLFIIGLVIFALGSPFGWMFLWVNIDFFFKGNLFLIPGIGFGIILLSLLLMSVGSRVGDDSGSRTLVTKRGISTLGKLIFIAGFLVLIFGSMVGGLWIQAMLAGFALILLSFILLAAGSRVGDKQA